VAGAFKDDRLIRLEERDVNLELDRELWPSPEGAPSPRWEARSDEGVIRRDIAKAKPTAVPLREQILRFPSAPIHGLHRLNQEHVNMGPVETFHTLRLLSKPDSTHPVQRIFILHNGLNETDKMGLYYRLASHLIVSNPGTVCILRPFPGHLTRCASPGLSEKPLDHYLWDGLHLFRQFLRFMIETRWLLSALARYSYYHCVSGSGLLGQSRQIDKSRLDPGRLSELMRGEWLQLHRASSRSDDAPRMPAKPTLPSFEQAVTSLQRALGLDQMGKYDGSSFLADGEPQLHALGYSLGGFTAQSVFMSWPFLVSTCSTLLSGGALRELAPTAFADPEEWQTVLHSLRYELDDAMMDSRFQPARNGSVAGMDPLLFRFLKRTFYEVFEQEYRGSFQTRLVAFRTRMFFVVGGNDPIVRPQSVLDSAPPDGINLLQVGGMGHFLEGTADNVVEEEQREFWIPRIGGIVAGLANRAGKKHREAVMKTWLNQRDELPESYRASDEDSERDEEGSRKLSVAERLEVQRDGTLPSLLFQRALDDLLARVTEQGQSSIGTPQGVLFILKNEAPTFLLDEKSLQLHASALFHEDLGTADYIAEVRRRRGSILAGDARRRIAVVLPWNLETITKKIDAGLQHPSQSESSGEQMMKTPDPASAQHTWEKLMKRCLGWSEEPFEDSIRILEAEPPEHLGPEELASLEKVQAEARSQLKIESATKWIAGSIPDCWVWMSNRFLRRSDELLDEAVSVSEARVLLGTVVPTYLGRKREGQIAEKLRTDDLRILSMSRARYNPRFRGRVIANPRQAQEILLQVSLCVGASVPFAKFDFQQSRDQPPSRARSSAA
jgi:hypothetical protein